MTLRLTTPIGVIEGEAEDIARLLREMHGTVAGAPVSAIVVPAPMERETDRLRKVPNNDHLLADYANVPGVSIDTRRARVRTVEEFEHHIAPKSLIDATIDDVRSFERRLVDKCAHAQATFLAGRGPGLVVPKQRCRAGEYDWTLTTPPTCSPKCQLFKRQLHGPRAHLKSLTDFYAWLQERGLVTTNHAQAVLRKHSKTLGEGADEGGKYTPNLVEVRALLRASRIVKTPRDTALLLVLAKTGRRPGHVVLIHAADLKQLHEPGRAYIDLTGVLWRRRAINGSTATKLKKGLIAPLDEETRIYLVNEYLPWRQVQYGYTLGEGPLFPGTRSREKHIEEDMIDEFVLDPIMLHLRDESTTPEERARWGAHLERNGDDRWSAGCFRNFFTNALDELKVVEHWIDVLRGDKVKGAKRHYLEITPEKAHANYRMHALLSDGPAASSARQARLPGA